MCILGPKVRPTPPGPALLLKKHVVNKPPFWFPVTSVPHGAAVGILKKVALFLPSSYYYKCTGRVQLCIRFVNKKIKLRCHAVGDSLSHRDALSCIAIGMGSKQSNQTYVIQTVCRYRIGQFQLAVLKFFLQFCYYISPEINRTGSFTFLSQLNSHNYVLIRKEAMIKFNCLYCLFPTPCLPPPPPRCCH